MNTKQHAYDVIEKLQQVERTIEQHHQHADSLRKQLAELNVNDPTTLFDVIEQNSGRTEQQSTSVVSGGT